MDAHQRLGHISPDTIRALAHEESITGLHLLESSLPVVCDSCIYRKMMHKASPKTRIGPCSNKFGGEVHTDVYGPSPTKSLGGKTYYLSFTDDKTRYTQLYLLTHKSGAFEAWACTQHNARILALHSDRGGEYLSGEFDAHLIKQGTE